MKKIIVMMMAAVVIGACAGCAGEQTKSDEVNRVIRDYGIVFDVDGYYYDEGLETYMVARTYDKTTYVVNLYPYYSADADKFGQDDFDRYYGFAANLYAIANDCEPDDFLNLYNEFKEDTYSGASDGNVYIGCGERWAFAEITIED